MRAAATLCLVIGLVAGGGAQPAQTPRISAAAAAVDRAELTAFVEATDADRLALLDAHPEYAAEPFREALAVAGNTLRTARRFDEAERFYRAVLFIGEHRGLRDARGLAYNNLGIIAGMRGDLPAATAFMERALAIAEEDGDVRGMQSGYGNFGIIQRRLGALDEAEVSGRRALALAEQLGDQAAIGRALNNLGILIQQRGDGATAQDYFVRSLRMKEAGGAEPRDLATSELNLGGLYAEQGDQDRAMFHYTHSIELMERDGLPDAAMLSALNNIGNSLAGLRRYAEARRFYERGIAAAERSGESPMLAALLYNVGTLTRATGDLDAALDLQRRSLAIRESISDRAGLVESLTEMGNLLMRLDRAAEGLPYLDRAVTLAHQARLLNQLWKAQLARGESLRALGRLEETEAAYTASLANVERLRYAAAGGDDARRRFLEDRTGPYYGLASLRASQGRAIDALATIEMSRSRVLGEVISGGRQRARTPTAEEAATERSLIEAVRSATDAYDREAAQPSPDAARLAALDAAVERAQVARDAFAAEMFERRHELGFAPGATTPIDRGRLEALVPPGAAVLVFAMGYNDPWVYVVRRRAGASDAAPRVDVTATHLAVDFTRLSALCETFARQVATRDLAFGATARALYEALLQPVAGQLDGVSRLVIVPDGPLWDVPFQALITGRGRYVLEDMTVSYAPSLATLSALEARQSSRVSRAPMLVALGDPAASVVGSADATRGAVGASLPEARREVIALGQLYGASRSEVLTGTAASESALRRLAGRASVLHIATHGLLDDRNPMYSRLALAADPPRAAAELTDHLSDGRLEAWELVDMGLAADLVVLSACDTARGGFGWGEGVIGLSWSLFAAGASTAVVSQWPVDSASTTRLMIAFHRARLKRGGATVSPPAALRTAALSLLADPATRHPFYWAGFISLGAR
jgi:CHAT domain-containing protein/tetratricopeptide (TPR) repeat protein